MSLFPVGHDTDDAPSNPEPHGAPSGFSSFNPHVFLAQQQNPSSVYQPGLDGVWLHLAAMS